MVKNFFYKLLQRRHFWRYATFGEVAELYASRMLRMAATYIAGSFMSIYLYQTGYSIAHIGLFWAIFYLFKSLIALPIAVVVGWIGPKHGVLVSNLLYIPAMVCFALLPHYGWQLLIPTLILQGISVAMYTIAYNIDFSKVKSSEHAGKEIGYMNIAEKVTTGLSPLIGGFIAFLWGPQVTLIVAGFLFAFAAAPLLRTSEPVKTQHMLQFRGFPWRLFFKHSIAQLGVGFDVFASGTVWTLYVATVIIGLSSGNKVYAISGLLLSVVFVVALVASYVYGRLIDNKKGGELMRVGVVVNAITHFLRPFSTSPISVAGLNAANEAATTAYTLPYTRAVFDNADLSGSRTTYMGLLEILSNLGAGIAAAALWLVATGFGELTALKSFFFIAGGFALLVLSARFPLYKK